MDVVPLGVRSERSRCFERVKTEFKDFKDSDVKQIINISFLLIRKNSIKL